MNRILRREDLKYIACAIDAEGSLSFGLSIKNSPIYLNFHLHCDIVNTNKEWLEYLCKLLEISKLEVRDRGNGMRIIYSLYIPKLKLEELLPRILPYLIIKKEHAKVMLEYIKLRKKKGRKSPYDNREVELYERIKFLNSKSYGGKFIKKDVIL